MASSTMMTLASAPTAARTISSHSGAPGRMACLPPRGCSSLCSTSSAYLSGGSQFRQANQASLRGRAQVRHAFAVQAGLLDRFARVMRSYFNFYGDSALRELEDPRKILDQAVSEMQQDLIKLRQASAQVFATQRMMEAKQRQAKTEADEWYKRAEFALRKGDEDLAREALKRHKAFAATASTMDAQLQQHTKAADTLRSNIRLMESKLSEAKTKKETLQARAASAQATVQLNQSINGLVSGLQTVGKDGLAAFNRMEEKVLAMEAEAEAAGQTFGNDALEARFGMLEGGGGVEDDLIKLKTDMLAGGRALSGERQGYAFSMVFERD